MMTLPKIVRRKKQPYVAIAAEVTMRSIGRVAPPLIGKVAKWLASRGAEPAGPPFFRYVRIDMATTLALEVGFPTAAKLQGDGNVMTGVLPGGKFVTLSYTGPYRDLYNVTALLVGWAKERGIEWDVRRAKDGDHFGCRLEIYPTAPDAPGGPTTELAFRIAQ